MNEEPRIGISGGTFDPIHIGHLIVAQEICDSFELNKVLFIPVGNPPHKDAASVTNSFHRMQMVKHAILGNERFEALDIELKRDGYTYAIDTLTELLKMFQTAKFYYIIGSDVVFDLLTWKNYEEVFQLCEFIAVLRPGYQKENLILRIEELKKTFGARITLYEVPLIGVSSTLIRERIRNNRTVKYLLPRNIEEYIRQEKLYIGP